MSDWHFGMVYPPVYWTAPDYDYELPEPTEAANIEGTLLVNAEEVEQIRRLKDENAKLRELVRDLYGCGDSCTHCRHWNQGDGFYCDLGVGWKARRMRELGVEVD